MSIKKIYNRIKVLLESNSDLRESDRKLLSRVWYDDLIKLNINPDFKNATQFLVLLSEGKLTLQSSITRARRKVMEDHPSLRGLTYATRQSKEKLIKKEITTWPSNIK